MYSARPTTGSSGSAFSIPMRGNELWEQAKRLGFHFRFSIPMRGNEEDAEVRLVEAGRHMFSIPMRGNERTCAPASSSSLAIVFDPHEG